MSYTSKNGATFHNIVAYATYVLCAAMAVMGLLFIYDLRMPTAGLLAITLAAVGAILAPPPRHRRRRHNRWRRSWDRD